MRACAGEGAASLGLHHLICLAVLLPKTLLPAETHFGSSPTQASKLAKAPALASDGREGFCRVDRVVTKDEEFGRQSSCTVSASTQAMSFGVLF